MLVMLKPQDKLGQCLWHSKRPPRMEVKEGWLAKNSAGISS